MMQTKFDPTYRFFHSDLTGPIAMARATRRTAQAYTLTELAGREVPIAVSTSADDDGTLTVQVATRLDGKQIAAQLYVVPDLPNLTASQTRSRSPLKQMDDYAAFFQHARLRPTTVLTSDLSLGRMLSELYQLGEVDLLSRFEGDELVAGGRSELADNLTWNDRKSRWEVPEIRVILIGHDLPRHFGRIFGRDFFDDLVGDGAGSDPLLFDSGTRLTLRSRNDSWGRVPPIVEYIRDQSNSLFRLRMDTFDINLPFGKDSLKNLSETFLELGTPSGLTDDEQSRMRQTREEHAAVAHGHMITDVITTLLISEQMLRVDRELHDSLGLQTEDLPPMRKTTGSRVCAMVTEDVFQAAGSRNSLDRRSKVKRRMRESGITAFTDGPCPSRFGAQTAHVTGGLTFSRSPYRFWHESPGMLRDIDMSSCYPTLLSSISVCWGRPVILEPGRRKLNLREAVEFLSSVCNPDAWFIRATGDFAGGDNVLIPSLIDARTTENYGRRRSNKPSATGTKLFSRRIEAGVVTNDTWSLIQMLPEPMRSAYEQLQVDSLVFYPREMAADVDGFEQRRTKFQSNELPWESQIDINLRNIGTVEFIDHRYATLQYQVGELISRMIRLREASKSEGARSGLASALKLQANALYGVLASPHFATFNPVAANIVTAAARARVFALFQALNGIQVITDGCTYRKDQIPACTLEECLRLKPDFLLNRADASDNIPFVDPRTIPDDPKRFKTWYLSHARRFFGTQNSSSDQFFTSHELVHKEVDGRPEFDALSTEGSSSYSKWRGSSEGGFKPIGSSMRGYSDRSRRKILDWIIEVYPSSQVNTLPPVTQSEEILRLPKALKIARSSFRSGESKVRLPLGDTDMRTCLFQSIRPSAFVFQTPRQRKSILQQWTKFASRNNAGLELLAIRQKNGRGRHRTLESVSRSVFSHLRNNGRDLTKLFHLQRVNLSALTQSHERTEQKDQLRNQSRTKLTRSIGSRRRTCIDPTGVFMTRDCVERHLHPPTR